MLAIAAYAALLGGFALAVSAVVRLGSSLPAPAGGSLALLLVQALVIIVAARLCSRVLARLGQPPVVGEVIGGVLLGPSVLGWLFPALFARLFPPASLATLNFLSQIGLVVFMFVVGMELDLGAVSERADSAVLVSHASIAVPFLFGALSALPLYGAYAPAGLAFRPFCLFMGISLSITAFPVLARILRDKDLIATPLGSLALACAAVDDVTAWCILAFVVSVARGGTGSGAARTLLAGGLYVLAMAALARPALERWLARMPAAERAGRSVAAAALCVLFASAAASELIGLHALFGAFLAGVVMPREAGLRQRLVGRLEDFSTLILLPLFFAVTGLRTRIGLLTGAGALAATAGITALATVGKVGGGAAAARWSGLRWRDSLAVGALMNTRGLMELVALNIGYELGLVTPALFAMLVVMALATTLLTGPLLELLRPAPSKIARRSAALEVY